MQTCTQHNRKCVLLFGELIFLILTLYFTLLGRDLGDLILQMFHTWSTGLYKRYGILHLFKNIGNFEFINFLSCKVNYGFSFHNYKMETTSYVAEFLFLLLRRLFHYVSCVICKWNVSGKGLKNQRSSCSINCIFIESMKNSLELCSSCYKKELVLFMLLQVFSRFFFFLTSFG